MLEIKDPSSERILSHCGKLTPLQHRRQFSYNLPLLFFNKREYGFKFLCELVQAIFRVIEFSALRFKKVCNIADLVDVQSITLIISSQRWLLYCFWNTEHVLWDYCISANSCYDNYSIWKFHKIVAIIPLWFSKCFKSY